MHTLTVTGGERATLEGESIHDWNGIAHRSAPRIAPKLLDETLRDGLQSASVHDPSIEAKLELLHHMVHLGIDAVALGIPCARPRQFEDTLRLAREIADQRLPIKACCAARTRPSDIDPIIEISQRAGIPIEVGTFVGSSPIRQYVERWDADQLERMTAEAVSYAGAHGLPVLFVTEDSTRSAPAVLERLYRTAIRCGAGRVCVADTVGHATPSGAARIVGFVASVIDEMDVAVGIDWHGHRDRGFDLANSFAAWSAGAERCHGTALGVGERAGNTPMELLLLNLHLEGWTDQKLTHLRRYIELASRSLHVRIPLQYPALVAGAMPASADSLGVELAKVLVRGG